MSISLFIAGDVVPSGRTSALFQKKDKSIFKELKPHIKSDLNIVNFEAPILGNAVVKPIKKIGPSLKSSKETLDVLKDSGFNLITLANNHFRDYGQAGVLETLEYAKKIDIYSVGGGKDLESASKPFVFVKQKESVSIINVCENEFSVATAEYGGSNPLDIVDLCKAIKREKKTNTYVIVIIHGGVEMYNLPTPRMQKWYRFFIEQGADAVINHHQHCFSGFELYLDKPIFYGLGNLCFDELKRNCKITEWNRGFAVKLWLDRKIKFELVPYIQCADSPKIHLTNDKAFYNDFSQYSQIIQDPNKLKMFWLKYYKEHEKETLAAILPNRIQNSLYWRGFNFFSKECCLKIKNRLSCETHLELTLDTLRSLCNV